MAFIICVPILDPATYEQAQLENLQKVLLQTMKTGTKCPSGNDEKRGGEGILTRIVTTTSNITLNDLQTNKRYHSRQNQLKWLSDDRRNSTCSTKYY